MAFGFQQNDRSFHPFLPSPDFIFSFKISLIWSRKKECVKIEEKCPLNGAPRSLLPRHYFAKNILFFAWQVSYTVCTWKIGGGGKTFKIYNNHHLEYNNQYNQEDNSEEGQCGNNNHCFPTW